jgi:hypothetical protein
MSYCPNCAAVLDPNLKFCSRCGQATGVAAATPPPVSVLPSAVEGTPASVNVAIAILVVALLINIVGVVNFIARFSRYATPQYLTRAFGFDILWILFVIGLWMRQNWARFAVLALTVWGAGQLLFNIVRFSTSPSFSIFTFAMPIGLAALHIVAVVLLFQSASSAWFKK